MPADTVMTSTRTKGMLAGVPFEGNCTATPKRWGSLVNVLALSTFLQEDIISIFPDVPLHVRTLVQGHQTSTETPHCHSLE